ncbi:MAG TPA: DUF2842 domain-containing protein [Rhizomicrobium sp.]|nr:DUF2842 domain-containing protein [Rhizomicrobium sp.]
MRKLVGTLGMIVWLAVYAIVAAGIGVRVLPRAAWPIILVYYALAGTLWIVPVGLMLPWMHRTSRRGPEAS